MADAEAVIETVHGKIELAFHPDKAPGHVDNFKKLAKDGFYDGTTFHRVIPGFMIQGGDPNSKSDDRSRHGTARHHPRANAQATRAPLSKPATSARSGKAPLFTYAVKDGFARMPVTFVSWNDAARFCNWLHRRTGRGNLLRRRQGR